MKRWLPMALGGALGIAIVAAQASLNSILTWGFAAMAGCALVIAVRKAPTACRNAHVWRRAHLLIACGAALVAVSYLWPIGSTFLAWGVLALGGVGFVGGHLWLRTLRTIA